MNDKIHSRSAARVAKVKSSSFAYTAMFLIQAPYRRYAGFVLIGSSRGAWSVAVPAEYEHQLA